MALFGGIKLVDRPDPENIRRLDSLQMPVLRQMHRYGFRIDPEHLRYLEHKLTTRMSELRREIGAEIPVEHLDKFMDTADEADEADDLSNLELTALTDLPPEPPPPEFNVESSVKIAELLYTVLNLDTTAGVTVKKTKSGDRLSTGKKTLEQLKRSHPVVPLILEYRENAKLNSTYVRPLPVHARLHPHGPGCPLCGRKHYEDELRVHTTFTTTRAITGRICSKNPNLANIPARTKLGAEIRRAFICSRGYRIVQRDWSQIELRLLGDAAREPIIIAVYMEGGDIHIVTAMKTFGLSDKSQVDKLLHRAPAKNVNFAVVYGITGLGLLDLMAITYATAGVPMPDYMDEDWCNDFIDKWFGVYTSVRKYLNAQEAYARRYKLVCTRLGRVRRIPGVLSALPYIQEAGIREGCNHAIQGFSADLMKLALGELDELLTRYREHNVHIYPTMTVYDELLNEAPEDDAEMLQAGLSEIMDNVLVDKQTGRLESAVPICSDGKIMQRWEKE